MSHEGIKGDDNRTDEQIESSKKNRFRRQAEDQLRQEGKSGFCKTEREFLDDRARIAYRAYILEEKAEYERLKKKYR